MKAFKGNLLVQFSVVSLMAMVVFGAIISAILWARLDRQVDLLRAHSRAMTSGTLEAGDPSSMLSITRDIHNLRWLTYGVLGGGFAFLYLALVLIVRDGWITIRRQQAAMRAANEELGEARSRLSLILDSVGEGIYGVDLDGRTTFVNPAAAMMLGWEVDELARQAHHTFLHPAGPNGAADVEEECSIYACITDGTVHHAANDVFWRRSGTSFPVEYTTTPIREAGRSVGAVVVFKDITEHLLGQEERRMAEERIKASLTEKEVLLKEIHHRVKNNLQVVSSLLALQADSIQHEADLDMLKDSQARVRSMALIHEELYRSEDMARVDFGDYLQRLVSYLTRSYNLNPLGITTGIDVEQVYLSVDAAIPCGLITSELVTNALKYAFPDDRRGEIRVGLRRADDGTFTLTVSDDGVGLPAHIDWRNTESLGMQLVNTLATQLNGKIELECQDGTEFKITFAERED